MSIEDKKQRQLERLYDGELSPRKAKRLRDELEADPQLQREFDELSQLSSLIRQPLDDETADVSFDGLWRGVLGGIEQSKPLGFWDRLSIAIREHFAINRRVWVASLASAVAVLLCMLPFLWQLWSTPGAAHRSAPISNELRVESWEAETGDVVVHYPKSKDEPTIIYHFVEEKEKENKNTPPQQKKPKKGTDKPL